MSRLIVALVIAVAALVLGIFWYRGHGPQPQPGQGTPWTVLQDIEEQHRADSSHDAPLLISHPEKSGYLVLGLPTSDPGFPWAWILLNEHAADNTPDAQPKMMPANARFHVDCAYIGTLLAQTPADPSVKALLQRRCTR
jgi:hypothetical protein